jgi:hypothetical protein
MTIAQKQETWSVDNWQAAAAERRNRLLNPPNAKTELPQERVKPPEFARPVTCYFQPIGPQVPFKIAADAMPAVAEDPFEGKRRAKNILKDVADRHRVLVGDILGPRRMGEIVRARFEAMNLVAIAFPHWSLPELGRFFGGRDHTTVLHAIRKGGAWEKRAQLKADESAASAAMCEGA